MFANDTQTVIKTHHVQTSSKRQTAMDKTDVVSILEFARNFSNISNSCSNFSLQDPFLNVEHAFAKSNIFIGRSR